MINDVEIWLERLSSLQRSLMRKAANAEGLQFVHCEILQYLSVCNRYSNTAQALSDYLGQTKGSISQSLSYLEEQGYVERKPDPNDKRVSRLFLTSKAETSIRRMYGSFLPELPDNPDQVMMLKDILAAFIRKNDSKGFGQCKSCKYNQKKTDTQFLCGLTGDTLTVEDTKKLCREHVFEDIKPV